MNSKARLMLILLVMVITPIMILGCATKTETTIQIAKDVTAQEAFNLIEENKNNPDFIIVDVRTPKEFVDGHIENAINMDFNSGVFSDEINKLDRAKKYLVYCRIGNRSRGAVNEMTELAFKEIYHLYVGIIGWSEAGYPVKEIRNEPN